MAAGKVLLSFQVKLVEQAGMSQFGLHKSFREMGLFLGSFLKLLNFAGSGSLIRFLVFPAMLFICQGQQV
jgi:hypothetical protein